MILKLAQRYPVSVLCQVLGYPRSSYYYASKRQDDVALIGAIQDIAGQWPRYGYRRITAQLRRQGRKANGKRVRRVMHRLGLCGKSHSKKRRTTDSQHDFPRFANLVLGLQIVRPEQVWVADITYVKLLTEFVYLAVIMDVFTRGIRGWHLARSLDHALTLTALNQALGERVPEIHHSDQGVQYAASGYVERLEACGVQISMADVGQAWQNGYAERLMRTIKEEEVDLSDYDDYHDAYTQIGRFLDDVYMHKRIHSSLGYLTPAEFETQWLARQAATPGVV